MSDLIRALVLGVIEGLTEFLPVSSTGHMILALPLLHVNAELPHWRVFLFVSQLGAILAVVAYFWRDLWRRALHWPGGWRTHVFTKLAAAMIPTVVLGLLGNDFMETYFENSRTGPPATAIGLIVGAAAIVYIDRRFRRAAEQTLDDVTLRQAFLIGLIQCISMWPGVSRAGASIMGGMALGLTPRVATEFSFYLAIPTMLAAGALRLWKYRGDLTADAAGVILAGTLAAFVTALLVVAAFLSYVRSRSFTPFAVYRVALGAGVLAWYWLG